jgi:hypothetical protein
LLVKLSDNHKISNRQFIVVKSAYFLSKWLNRIAVFGSIKPLFFRQIEKQRELNRTLIGSLNRLYMHVQYERLFWFYIKTIQIILIYLQSTLFLNVRELSLYNGKTGMNIWCLLLLKPTIYLKHTGFFLKNYLFYAKSSVFLNVFK